GGRPQPLYPAAQWRFEEQRHQASRFGTLWRHERVPDEREGIANQDGARREAGRRGAIAGVEGLSVDRESAAINAGRWLDFAAAASRYLFDRGPGRVNTRPKEQQPRGAHQRQAS